MTIPIIIIIIGGVWLVSLTGVVLWLKRIFNKQKELELLLKDQDGLLLKRDRFLKRLNKILESTAPMFR